MKSNGCIVSHPPLPEQRRTLELSHYQDGLLQYRRSVQPVEVDCAPRAVGVQFLVESLEMIGLQNL